MNPPVEAKLRLFDELLDVLKAHPNDAAAQNSIEFVKALKYNYEHRDMERFMNALLRVLDDLLGGAGPEVTAALQRKIHERNESIGRRREELARQYEEKGGRLLSLEEIQQEVRERRGG